MIPLSLTIEGIYSYKNRTTVNFSELFHDHLFGIFGPVGSGKSTLLEAMTYAIYGQTERMNRHDKVSANMLNLSSDEMYIEFSFIAQNQTWTAIRELKRSGRQKQNIEVLPPSFYKLSGEEQIPVSIEEVQNAIGLSYDNFRRVVIIPQGKFQEFLQLGDSERSEMMKELFPELRKYDLAENANTLLAQTNEQLTFLSGKIQSFGEIDSEFIVQKENLLKEKETQQLLLKTQEEVLVKQENHLEKLKQLFEKLATEAKNLDDLKAKNPDAEKYEKAANNYEFCVNTFKTNIATLDDIIAEIKNIELSLKQSEVAKQKTLAEQQQLAGKLAEITPLYNDRNQMADKAEDLRKIAEILIAKNELSIIQANLQHQEGIKQTKIKQLGELQAQLKTIADNLLTLKSQLLDEDMLNAVSKWFSEYKLLKANDKDVAKLLAQSQQEQQASQQILDEFTKKETFIKLEVCNYPNMVDCIALRQKELEKQKLQTEEKQREVLVKQKFSEHAMSLQAGVPCPLCGATEHPNIASPENNEAEMAKLKNEIVRTNENLKELQTLLIELNKLDANRQNIIKNIDKAAEQRKISQEALIEHKSSFPTSPFLPEQKEFFLQTLEKNRTSKKDIAEKENSKLSTEKAITETDTQIRKEEVLVNELKTRITTLETIISEKNNTLKLLSIELYKDFSAEQLKEMSAKLIAEQKKIEDSYTDLNKKRETNTIQSAQLESIIQLESTRLKNTEAKHKEIQLQLDEKLSASNYTDFDQIRNILANKLDTINIRTHITAHREKLHTAQQNCNSLREQINNDTYNTEQHNELKTTLFNQKQQIDALNQELGKLKTEISTLKANLETQKALKTELQQQQIRQDNLIKLRSLFSGNKFVKFVSTLYLQEMCKAANERFMSMTQNRLRLELNENANFIIRDFMNEGKTRSVKTLSGGQTFQAALALALAMTDNLAVGENTKNFFFLDEGFGSQDKDSLRIVFDTLQSLRNENRIVGLISHVEEMKEELTRYLLITNTGDEGSKIKTSWESE